MNDRDFQDESVDRSQDLAVGIGKSEIIENPVHNYTVLRLWLKFMIHIMGIICSRDLDDLWPHEYFRNSYQRQRHKTI